MADEQAVLVTYPRDDVMVVTLNRPAKLNPMNNALVDGIDAALAKAEEIIANSPWAIFQTKEVMWSALEIPGRQAAADLENRTQVLAGMTADATEARMAFLEK